MSYNQHNSYNADAHIAEVYDQVEAHTEDVVLLRRLLGETPPLRILEPFCGTGRILIPLACEGHILTGLDQSGHMLDRARAKVQRLSPAVQGRVTLSEADVTAAPWPDGMDLVILSGNCFYELATPEEQERCVAFAAEALNPGGYVYIDNDHMEGALDPSWQETGVVRRVFSGTCRDGARVEETLVTVGYDVRARLARFRRRVVVTLPNGEVVTSTYVQQKHPVSTDEVRTWLERHGFEILRLYGDRTGASYTTASERAIFWARKCREG